MPGMTPFWTHGAVVRAASPLLAGGAIAHAQHLLRRGRDALSLEPALHRAPVHVCEERVDVLRPVGRGVIQYEGMLPRVHDDNRVESADITDLMQGDPMV